MISYKKERPVGEAVMELGDRELEKIGKYVQSHLEEWSRGKVVEFRTEREVELLERMVRVEEGLKTQSELMRQGFEQMEKRFEQIDKRFEQVDKRFESFQYTSDKRFEQVDKRFELLQHHMDKRFSQLQWTMGTGFTLLAALLGVFHFL